LEPLSRRPAWTAVSAYACTRIHPVVGAIGSFTASEGAARMAAAGERKGEEFRADLRAPG